MAVLVRVQVYGRQTVVNNLGMYKKRKIQRIADITNDTAVKINRKAKMLAKVDTGNLQSRITMKKFDGGLVIDVGTNVLYAKYVEYGTGIYASHPSIPGRKTPWMYKDRYGRWWWTRGARPRPFLIPAFDSEEDDYVKRIKRELRGL